MPFNPNIPQAADSIAISQADILNNFGVLGAIAGNGNPASDSINLNAGFNWIYLPNQGAKPPAGSAFPVFEIGLYSALNVPTNQYELYINKRNQNTTVQIPSTASILSVNSAPAKLTAGWTYLPSGILLKWAANIVANGQTNILFPVAANIPVFTTCMTVIVQIADGFVGDANEAIRLTDCNPNSFDVYGSSRTVVGATPVTFTYLAIGY